MQIGTIGRNRELYDEFMKHPSFEIFDYDEEIFKMTNQRPKLTVNVEKLNKYIKFVLKIRVREEGKTHIYRSLMTRCTPEMYEQRNYNQNETSTFRFDRRLCPEVDAIKDFWKLKNGYSNEKERISFNI